MDEEDQAKQAAHLRSGLAGAVLASFLADAMLTSGQLQPERRETLAHLLRVLAATFRDAGHEERANETDAIAIRMEPPTWEGSGETHRSVR